MQWAQEHLTDTFEQSLSRCLCHGDFIGAFYQRFLDSSDDVQRKFAGTDFDRQKLMLKRSLYLMARASLQMEDGLEHLETVARSHSRRQLDVRPSHYELWLDALVNTASDFDPHFSDGVELAWRKTLRPGIDRMIAVYRREQTIRPKPSR